MRVERALISGKASSFTTANRCKEEGLSNSVATEEADDEVIDRQCESDERARSDPRHDEGKRNVAEALPGTGVQVAGGFFGTPASARQATRPPVMTTKDRQKVMWARMMLALER